MSESPSSRTNPKRRRYTIVTEDSPEALVENVNEYIAAGYEPLGGVSCAIDGLHERYHQAMIGPPLE